MLRTPALVASLFLIFSIHASADNWPQWRGPIGSGVTSEQNLPMRWSAAENIAWRTRLPGLGVSTPVVWDDRVFVTSQLGAGVREGGNHPSLVQGEAAATAGERNLGGASGGAAPPDRVTFIVSAHQWSDGSRLWQHETVAEGPMPAVHDKHNLATASPVTDGQVVIAWFGTG